MKTRKINYNKKAVYIGRRLSKEKVLQAFLIDGKEIYFSGIKRVILGYTYKCSQKFISTKPERTNDERIENSKWEAEDELVNAHRREKRIQKDLEKKSKPLVKNAVNALIPLTKGMGYVDMRILVNHLVDVAYEKNKK